MKTDVPKMPGIVPDDNYTLIPKRPDPTAMNKGIQCGECGMKFDRDTANGFCCGNTNCPIQTRITL